MSATRFLPSALIETDWISGNRAKASAGMGSRAAALEESAEIPRQSAQAAPLYLPVKALRTCELLLKRIEYPLANSTVGWAGMAADVRMVPANGGLPQSLGSPQSYWKSVD